MTGVRRALARLAAAAILLAILLATLTPDGDRLVPEEGEPWCLVCGARGGADVVRNVLLFAPLGGALVLAGLRPLPTLALAVATTLGIEVAQLAVVGGRSGTASDVLANATGALLGVAVAASRRTLARPSAAAARRLALAGGAAALAVSAAGAWLVAPAPPLPGTRAMAPLPNRLVMRPFDGHVERSALGGRPVILDGRPVAPFALPALPETLRVEAAVAAMLPPGLLRPFAHALAPDGRPVFVVGQRQRHLAVRVRRNAARLRLDDLQFELRDAFPAGHEIPSGRDPRRGPRVDVAATVGGGWIDLRAARAGDARAWRVALSPHLAWVLAAAPLRVDRRTVHGAALWVAALLLPVAYWAGRGWPARRALPVVAAGGALLLLAVPAAAGFPPPAPWEWAGAVAGVAVGAVLARRGAPRTDSPAA